MATPATPITQAVAQAEVRETDWLNLTQSLEPACIDLLYADPPFNTGNTQSGQAGMYQDSWPTTEAWIDWLRQRLIATFPALKPTASILLHVDWRTSHHARLLLDDLLGPQHFVNHLIWTYGLGGSSPRRFARKHDDILFYAIDPSAYYFQAPMVPATSKRMAGEMKKATDIIDIPALNNMASERTGYPTQKPLALLKLLINACSPTNALVLDPVCGSGTTLIAAAQLGRNAMGCDINPDAVQVTQERIDSLRTNNDGGE